MSDRPYSEMSETKPRSALLAGLAQQISHAGKSPVGPGLQLLGSDDAAALLEKLAYGDRLTKGMGQTLQPADSVVEGALALSPVITAIPKAGKFLARGLARVR